MRIIDVVGLLFVLFSLFSCQKAADRPAKIVCVLFDFSESTNSPEIRKRYVHDFRPILAKINAGDVVVAGPITEKSVAEPEFILNCEFPQFVPTTDNLILEKAERRKFEERILAIKDSLCSLADTALTQSGKKILRTDIISSLHVAERIFKSFIKPKRVLVIMSDMIEDSETYHFDTDNLTPQRTDQIIAIEKENRRIPELKGTKIYVIGATAKNKEKFFQIRDFWLRYFLTCGANLPRENYGATLVKFDE